MSIAHFVFVHGACHGAWCWYKVRTLLESVGHRVTCLDLAGAGINPSNPDDVASVEEYNRPLTDFLASLSDQDQIILVGHSAGGASITNAILRFEEKIQLAIYVVGQMARGPVPGIVSGLTPDVVIYNYANGPSKPPTSMSFRPEALGKRLYNRSPIQDITLAPMLLRPVPKFNPSTDKEKTSVNGNNEDFKKVKRVYIRTMDDQLFGVENQNLLIEAWPPWKVFDVDSDHSPFFSAPEQLFAIFLQVIYTNTK